MTIKRLTEHTLVARVLRWLAGAIFHHRGWFLYPQLVLCAICVVYSVRNLKVDTKRGNLVGANAKYQEFVERVRKEFPAQDNDLVVVVESEESNKSRQFVERLGLKLEAETNLYRDIFYKGDLKTLGSKALLFVPEADLAQLKEALADTRPFLKEFTAATNLVSLFGMVNKQFRTAKREQNPENAAMAKSFAALERIVTEATASLKRRGNPPSPGVNSLLSSSGSGSASTAGQSGPEHAEQSSYITFGNGRIYLVTAQAARPELNHEAIQRLRTLVEETKGEVSGLNVGVTGETVLEYDEMAQSQRDTRVASIAAFLICALIFIYGYHETERPIKAILCLLVGVAYTFAFATATVGHLNVLTITFVPILIGLAIDYGVHLISRYEEELRLGRSQYEAMVKAMVYTGQGICTGAFTTAGAFWVMTLTRFRGIQEMGIICGGGLLVCLIPMITMLPVLLLFRHESGPEAGEQRAAERWAWVENKWLQRPVLVSCLMVAVCALAVGPIRKVYFDYNLMHMQSAGLASVEFEKKLLDSGDKSLLFAAVLATNLHEAALLTGALTNLSTVSGVESITQYLSEDQGRQLDLVRDIKAELATIRFKAPDTQPVDLAGLNLTLYSLYGYLGAAYSEVQKEDPRLAGQLASLRQAIKDLRKEMLRGTSANLQTNSLKLAAFQKAFFNDVRQTFEVLKNQESDSPLRNEDLPQVIRNRFVGVTGKYLLMVYPKKDLRDRENQKEFIDQVQAVYPAVAGSPIQLYYYTELLRNSYEEAARYSLVAIVSLVLFHFRSLMCIILALIPVGVGFLWLGGIMGLLGLPFNPANIMILPLVIGIGVTNGIHVLNRFAEEQTPSILARSTGKAVLVSGLTSIAGFGSLVLGKHQGIQSLGFVMSCGLATCMVAGLVCLPTLLKVLTGPPQPKERSSPKHVLAVGHKHAHSVSGSGK